jgi:hypothetical protein
MSNWTQDEVDALCDQNGGGNAACRHIWLAKAPPCGGRYSGGSRPKQGDRIEIFKQFVLDCYDYGKFKADTPYTGSVSSGAAVAAVASSAPLSRASSATNTPTSSFKATTAPAIQRPAPVAPHTVTTSSLSAPSLIDFDPFDTHPSGPKSSSTVGPSEDWFSAAPTSGHPTPTPTPVFSTSSSASNSFATFDAFNSQPNTPTRPVSTTTTTAANITNAPRAPSTTNSMQEDLFSVFAFPPATVAPVPPSITTTSAVSSGASSPVPPRTATAVDDPFGNDVLVIAPSSPTPATTTPANTPMHAYSSNQGNAPMGGGYYSTAPAMGGNNTNTGGVDSILTLFNGMSYTNSGTGMAAGNNGLNGGGGMMRVNPHASQAISSMAIPSSTGMNNGGGYYPAMGPGTAYGQQQQMRGGYGNTNTMNAPYYQQRR